MSTSSKMSPPLSLRHPPGSIPHQASLLRSARPRSSPPRDNAPSSKVQRAGSPEGVNSSLLESKTVSTAIPSVQWFLYSLRSYFLATPILAPHLCSNTIASPTWGTVLRCPPCLLPKPLRGPSFGPRRSTDRGAGRHQSGQKKGMKKNIAAGRFGYTWSNELSITLL